MGSFLRLLRSAPIFELFNKFRPFRIGRVHVLRHAQGDTRQLVSLDIFGQIAGDGGIGLGFCCQLKKLLPLLLAQTQDLRHMLQNIVFGGGIPIVLDVAHEYREMSSNSASLRNDMYGSDANLLLRIKEPKFGSVLI